METIKYKLINAIEKGEIQSALRLIKDNPNLALNDEPTNSVLLLAAYMGNLSIIIELINNNINLNKFIGDFSPVRKALDGIIIRAEDDFKCCIENYKTAEYLINKGADISRVDDNDKNDPLTKMSIIKCKGNWNEKAQHITKLLMDRGEDFNIVAVAAALGNIDDVKKCLSKNNDIDETLPGVDFHPLHIAVINSDVELLKFLMLTIKDCKKNGISKSISLFKTSFIDYKINPYDADGRTPLDLAKSNSVINILKENGGLARSDIDTIQSLLYAPLGGN